MNANTPKVVFINTDLHRATLLDEDVSYPIEDLRQGRDATNPVPKFSMLAGKPIDDEEARENAARALFWQYYVGSLALIAVLFAAYKVFG